MSADKSNDNENDILKGKFDVLPDERESEIRIFLISTFEDYHAERDYIIENVYNDLRKHCLRQYLKDLTIIDLRWSITSELENEQLTSKISLNEIKQCEKQSTGPSFVVFLSHQYGPRMLNSNIAENEYEFIKNELDADSESINLFQKFYELDENNLVDKEYKLKNFKIIMNQLQVSEDEFQSLKNQLINKICKAVDNCFNRNQISLSQRSIYFHSATAVEIDSSILKPDEVNMKCMAFFREFKKNSPEKADSKAVNKYVENDEEKISSMKNLKQSVEEKLQKVNKYYYKLDWTKTNNFEKTGDTLKYSTYVQSYLKKFGEHFKISMNVLLGQSLQKEEAIEYDSEILHHARYCNRLTVNFIKRPHLKSKVKHYLDDKENTKPLIIGGESGAGKSCFLAYLAEYIKEKNPKVVVIIRFMGTSRKSSTMKSVIRSIIKQLDDIYLDENVDDEYLSVIELRDKFIEKLKATTSKSQKIIILLDGIDQLTSNDHSLNWMFYELPKNVKLIFTALSGFKSIFESLKKQNVNSIEIEKLKFHEAHRILSMLLSNSNRKLTEKQWSTLDNLLRRTQEVYPLHVKLLFDICSKWRSSYEIPDDFNVCISSKETIKCIIKSLEQLHGKVLLSHCLFYLTVFGYHGISENELEDILSIDDVVLNSVFKHNHPPPLRRFPIALWLNIKYSLGDYLVKKETDGVTTFSWFHKVFMEATREYYEDIFKPSEQRDILVMNIIDYFNETWNQEKSDGFQGKEKAFEFSGVNKLHKFKQNPDGTENEYLAYRFTKPQKLRYERIQDDKITIIYNRRKLSELVNIIMMLHDKQKKIELLKEHVYFNHEFMKTKAELHELNFTFDVHNDIIEIGDQELTDTNQVYVNNYEFLEKTPENLLVNVLSRLNSRSNYTKKLSSSSNLLLLNKFIDNDPISTVFSPNIDKSYILAFYVIQDLPFIFVETQIYEDQEGPVGSLHLISLESKEHLGQLDFSIPPMYINVALFEDYKTMSKLMDINGIVYYYYDNIVYSSNFSNSEVSIVKEFRENIGNLFLMGTKSLLVVFERKLVNYSSANKSKICQKIHLDEKIDLIRTNLEENKVYQPMFLNSVDRSVTIIVGLCNKHIHLYQFDSKNQLLSIKCKIEDINWNFYGFDEWEKLVNVELKRIRESIIIDETYLVDNVKTKDSVLIRFAIEQAGLIKIIDVKNDNSYTVVDEIDDKKVNFIKQDFEKLDSENLELIGLYGEKLVFSHALTNGKRRVYFYDLGNKTFIERETGGRVDYISECNIIALSYFTLDLVKPESMKLKNILSTNMFMFYPTKSVKVLGNKLLAIESNEYLLYGDSIKVIDMLSVLNVEKNASMIRIKYILCQLDEKFIIAETEKLHDHVIIDVSTGNVVQELESYKYVIGVNRNYLISINKENRKKILGINRISKEQDRFKFTEALQNQEFNENIENSDFVALFNESNPLKLMIKIYSKEEDSIQLLSIYDEEDICKCESFTVNLSQIESPHSNLLTTVTTLDTYLVVWIEDQHSIYYIDPVKDEIYVSIKTDIKIIELENLPNNNDILLHDESSVYFVSMNKTEKTIEITMLKDFSIYIDESNYWIKNGEEGIPFIINQSSNVIENFDTNMCISTEKTHVALINDDRELCVLKCKETMEQIASIHLEKEISQLRLSQKYVFGLIDQRLVTFEIINENTTLTLNSNLVTF